MATAPPPPARKARAYEAGLVVALLALIVVFGVVVEVRSAFLKRRMTDLGVYLRAAWAVRAGGDLYRVTDDNGWHYHYPPLLAVLLTPLADPPAGADRTGALPFPVSVGLWYLFSVGCLFLGIHWLAAALEGSLPGLPAPRSARWWGLRLIPLLVCLPGIGATLARGQVNLLVLLAVCAMIAAAIRGGGGRAGWWLAGAVGLKLIPIYLVVYPLWRRDARWLAGLAGGLVVCFAVVPGAAFGPARAWDLYREWGEVLVRPGLGHRPEHSRGRELTDVTGTDSQSFMAVFHNSLHLDRATRPSRIEGGTRDAHWLTGGVLTLLTLLAAARVRRDDGPATALLLGVLLSLMILLSPVCHLHYSCLRLPLVMGLLSAHWERRGQPADSARVGVGMGLLLAVSVAVGSVPHFPGMELARDLGVATYAGLLLWLAGCVELLCRGVRAPAVESERRRPLAA